MIYIHTYICVHMYMFDFLLFLRKTFVVFCLFIMKDTFSFRKSRLKAWLKDGGPQAATLGS